MPTSHFSQLNEIVQLIVHSDPRCTQDIGRQEAAFGNPYETRRFQWRRRHLHS